MKKLTELIRQSSGPDQTNKQIKSEFKAAIPRIKKLYSPQEAQKHIAKLKEYQLKVLALHKKYNANVRKKFPLYHELQVPNMYAGQPAEIFYRIGASVNEVIPIFEQEYNREKSKYKYYDKKSFVVKKINEFAFKDTSKSDSNYYSTGGMVYVLGCNTLILFR